MKLTAYSSMYLAATAFIPRPLAILFILFVISDIRKH